MSLDLDAIYDVLVDDCGASEKHRHYFSSVFPGCREFRFGGSLGFGGKVWSVHEKVYVTYYPEDETPERRAATERANVRLKEIAG